MKISKRSLVRCFFIAFAIVLFTHPIANAQQANFAGTILVWEGVAGGTDYSGQFIRDYLQNNGFSVDYRTSFPTTLTGYSAVFLSFGNSGNDGSAKTTFSASMASKVQSYLQAGGRLYLEGGDALGNDQKDNSILLGLLGLVSADDGFTYPVSNLLGQSNSIFSGISFTSSSQTNKDFIDRYEEFGGIKAFVESGYGTVGVQYNGFYGQKTIVFSYALSKLNDRGGSNTRNNVLSKIVDYFDLNQSEPNIELLPTSLNVAVFPDEIVQQTLQILNSGGRALVWSLATQKNSSVELILPNGEQLPASISPARNTAIKNNDAVIFKTQYPSLFRENTAANASLAFTGVNSGTVSLLIDDGGRENGIGLNNGGQFIWLNQFTPNPVEFPFTLEEVQVLFGSDLGVSVGDLIDIYIYEDSDSNLDNGATIVGSLTDASVQAVDDVTFSTYAISPIQLNGPGDVIIAIVNRTAGVQEGAYPAALDESNNSGRSWIGVYNGDPATPPVLPATSAWGKTADFGFPGNWMIRGFGSRSGDCSWLTPSVVSGILNAGQVENVVLTIDATGLTNGTYPCQLTITSNDPDEPAVIVPVTLTVKNHPPVVSSIANQVMSENTSLNINVNATDSEGHAIALSVKNLPTFGSFTDNGDGSGQFSFTPGFLDAGVYSGIRVIATDNGTPAASDSVEFSLTVTDFNRAPQISAIGDQNVNEAQSVQIAFSATDQDSDNQLSFSGLGLPAFAAITNNGNGTGVIDFSPGYDDAGVYQISIIVQDNGSPVLADTAAFMLTVNNVNRAPQFTAVANQSVNEGSVLSLTINVVDPDGDGLSISAVALPVFAALTDNGDGTGSIVFAPGYSDAGSYLVEVMAADNSNPILTDTLVFQVTVNDVNRSPVVAYIPNQQVGEGTTLTVPVSASDPDGNSLVLSSPGLPSFAVFVDSGNGSGSITFMPSFGDAGNYSVIIIATDNGTPALTDTANFVLTVGNINRPPELTAVANQQVNEGGQLNISVNAVDPDGDNIALAGINLPSFANFTDNGDGSGSVTFSPGFDDAGNYTISIVATDDDPNALSDTLQFLLTVSDVNRAPIISSPANQQVNENATLLLLITANDPDGDALSFSAPGLPSFGVLSDNGNGSGSLQFTPGFSDAGSYVITVIVSDGGTPSLSDTTSFVLTVSNTNRKPQLSTIANQVVLEGDTLNVNFSAIDPDGNAVSYSVINMPGFGNLTDLGNGSGILSFFPGFSDSGNYVISVVASDDGEPVQSDTATFVLRVDNVNRAPAVAPLSSQSLDEGTNKSITLSATDPDGDMLTWQSLDIPDFASLTNAGDGTATLLLSPDYFDAGVYTATLLVFDDGSPTLYDTLSFSVTIFNINRPPVFVALANQQMNEGETLNLSISAVDPDSNAILLSPLTLPGFGHFTDLGNGSGTINFDPDFTDAGVYSIEIIAIDNDTNALTDTLIFSLTVSNVNRSPVLAAIANQQVAEGETLVVPVSASDPDGDALSFSAPGLPSFGVLSDNGNGSGSLQFTPGFSDAGSYVITLVVSDGGLSDTTTFQLSVTQVNLPPVLVAIANQQVAEGETLVVPVSASDPDGDNISISAINIPVFGSLVDNGNGTATITFTPNFGDVGNYSVIIIAVDNGQPSLSDTVSFNLSVGDVNRPPVITPIANMQIPEGSIQNVQITATDPDGDFVILAAQNLPPFGLFADNGGGMGNIRLSPGYQDAGSYLIRVIATDTGSPSLKDTVEFTVVVENNNRAPIIANINDQQVEEGSILNVPVTASDPDSDIVIFSAAGLPSFGLFTDNGNGSGNFRFSPGYNDAGVYHISLIATDTGSPQKSDTISFVMTVSNNNRAPQLQPISDQAMSENDTLIMALTATDPDGDSLIYQVSGLPQFGQFTDNGDGTGELLFFPDYDDAGVYAITIQVSDTSTPPGTATLSFELTVENLNRPPVIAAIPDTTVSEGQELFIALTATDPDNDAIIFIAENLPAFAHLADSGNGQSTLHLQPGFSDTGVYPDVRIISLDTGLLSDTTVFQITVTDSNSAPVATADTLTLLEDESGILYILQNDYDPNGDPFKISAILDTLAYGNIIVLPGDSALQYEPQANFFGNMSFRYEISDSAGLLDTTSVLLKIMPVNDPPQITGLPDSITISGDSLVILNLSTFVTDVDDPFTTLTINFVSQPDTFNFQLVPDSGIVKITAKNPASSLVASVSITVTDTAGATATDTLIVQVIGAVGIDEQMANTPKEFEVFQNYPNPFNPTTTIKFGLPGTTHVKVSIFNTLGQRVAILLDETRPAGYHQVVFDAKTISSGMYFYVVETKTNRKIHKMLLIK